MNFWEYMELTGKELHIDAERWIGDFYNILRHDLERCIGNTWRITKITEQSTVSYDATLVTRTATNPQYIRAQILATFAVEARENGALDEIIEGIRVSIPRKTLHFTVQLMDNGYLRITESALTFPTKTSRRGSQE